MAKCRVLEKSFIENHICEVGEIVEYDGPLGANLELVDDELVGSTDKKPAKRKEQS